MRAILVFGPESSGTRLWTQILIAAGCHGSAEHYQSWDGKPPVGDLIVWRRSFPHSGKWPVVRHMVERLEDAGYDDVQALVATRDWHATIQSQIKHGHVRSREKALLHLRRAYPTIFGQLDDCRIPFEVVSFEALVARPEQYMAVTLASLGMGPPRGIDIYDANAKWYSE